MRHPQQLVGGLRDGISGSVSRICVLLMPSKNPGCCSASPSPLSKHAAHFSILDGIRKRWASLAAFHTAEESCLSFTLTFSMGEITGGEGLGTKLFHLRERVMQVK